MREPSAPLNQVLAWQFDIAVGINLLARSTLSLAVGSEVKVDPYPGALRSIRRPAVQS